MSRRTFVKWLGAGFLAAGAAGCAGPLGEIVPYVSQPPEVTPGVSLHYATAMELDGYATGLLVASREGRPIKIEGNPDHPASLGAAGAFEQAALLQLYDPDRPAFLKRGAEDVAWLDCASAFSLDDVHRVAGANGAGLRFLLEPTASPIVLELIGRIQQRFPAAAFHFYAPLVAGATADGTELAFGRRTSPVYNLGEADVIVTLDADLFGEGPFRHRYARQFADRRRVRRTSDSMNRLYAIEGAFTPTGIAADHRLAVRPSEMPAVAAALLVAAVNSAGRRTAISPEAIRALAQWSAAAPNRPWIEAAARDLVAHRTRAVVAAGPRQAPVVHLLAAVLNDAIGAQGGPVSYLDPLIDVRPEQSLAALVDAIVGGHVAALVVLGGNPSYNAPADLDFARAARTVPLSLYAGLHDAETARDVQWFVPLAHFLEAWGDARALDGTASIVQPLISPLRNGRSLVDLLAFFAGDDRPSYQIVRDFWRAPERLGGDEGWREALRHGVVPGVAPAPRELTVSSAAIETAVAREHRPAAAQMEVAFVPDSSVYDGRFANNPWLQELPDPVTKITWDNAALMSEATARTIGATAGELIDLHAGGRQVRVPVFLAPGVAERVIVFPFGYGRETGGSVAKGIGANAFAIWTSGGYAASASATPVVQFGVRLTHPFAVTSPHGELDGRPIVLDADLEWFRANPHFTAEHKGPVPSLYQEKQHGSERQWGMAIDLTVCTGCSGCVVACQAENNIPVVGKLGVQERREMHWLRIDRYLDNAATGPRLLMQPMLCQQCENAPCEYVCPVNATVHSPDGLNEMIYNRCVGTRFCSNNCPYKVRRFNWFNYTEQLPELEQMAMNPDVTVRARGVMEKCTFCVQRIRRAEIDAAAANSDEPFTELQTACQQACPTRAIVFGPINDPKAAVTADARADHSYRVLNDVGTRPRIYYLARLRNPNPAIPGETT